MATCSKCGSTRILSVMGKCSDRSRTSYDGSEKDGYVPEIPGIGGGDYMAISVCCDCGVLQDFPVGVSDENLMEMIFGQEGGGGDTGYFWS